MKRFLFALAALLTLTGFRSSIAAEPVIHFDMPTGFFAELCKKPVWKGVEAVWGGVVDERSNAYIGRQERKGGEDIAVNSDPALAVVMNDALEDLFEQCGMALVEKASPNTIELSAVIRSFDVNVLKKTLSSEAASESMIRFVAQRGTKSQMIDVGMELESKGVRRGKLKALERAANELLLETLKEVPKNDHMLGLTGF